MNDNPSFNLVNPDSVREYLWKFAGGNERLAQLLCVALEKPLRKRAENIRTINAMPEDAPEWLKHKWETGGSWHVFDPKLDIRLASKIGHIADWICAALVNNAEWLDCVDEKSRPLKLLKIGSLEQATREADKAMAIARQHMSKEDIPGSTETVMRFESGFSIVELLTPQALDRESAYLGHCIGDGGYDEAVFSPYWRYLSLRDERNIPHVTMEVGVQSGELLQCKGKQNTPPVEKYVPYIRAFAQRYRLKPNEDPSETGLIFCDGIYYDVFNLPAGFEYDGSLQFGNANRALNLPSNLSVKGSLNLYYFRRPVKLPDNMTVDGNLELPEHMDAQSLPLNLHVKGDLSLSRWARLGKIPEGTFVEENISIMHCPLLETLPESFTRIKGGLTLCGCAGLKTLPEGLHITKENRTKPIAYSGELNLTGCLSLEELPENLYVEGPLYLNGCKSLKSLPRSITVKGNIFTDFGIFRTTEEFIGAFKKNVSWTTGG